MRRARPQSANPPDVNTLRSLLKPNIPCMTSTRSCGRSNVVGRRVSICWIASLLFTRMTRRPKGFSEGRRMLVNPLSFSYRFTAASTLLVNRSTSLYMPTFPRKGSAPGTLGMSSLSFDTKEAIPITTVAAAIVSVIVSTKGVQKPSTRSTTEIHHCKMYAPPPTPATSFT